MMKPKIAFRLSGLIFQKKDDLTGLHDHSQTAILSGVVYLKAAKDSEIFISKK